MTEASALTTSGLWTIADPRSSTQKMFTSVDIKIAQLKKHAKVINYFLFYPLYPYSNEKTKNYFLLFT
jgi:riboflavin transporter FmnP